MAYEQGDLEGLFRERLHDYKAQPSDKVWQNVAKHTHSAGGSFFAKGLLLSLVGITTLLSAYFLTYEYKSDFSHFQVQVVEDFVVKETLASEQRKVVEEVLSVNISEKKVEKKVSHSKRGERKVVSEETQIKPLETLELKLGEAVSADVGVVKEKKSAETLNNSKFWQSEQFGCQPLTVYFKNKYTKGIRYAWSFGDGATSDTENTFHTFTKAGVYPIKLLAISEDNTELVWLDTVIVFEKPMADCELSAQDMTDFSPVYFYNYSTNATTYEWSVGDSILSKDKEPVQKYADLVGVSVKLKVWSEDNCTDSLIIANPLKNKENAYIAFPNAFIPDHSGPSGGRYLKNIPDRKIFHPRFKGIEEYQLQIFNRFGIKVFETQDINIGWDGYHNQKLAAQGAYIWKVKGTYSNGKPFVKMGDVIVLRSAK